MPFLSSSAAISGLVEDYLSDNLDPETMNQLSLKETTGDSKQTSVRQLIVEKIKQTEQQQQQKQLGGVGGHLSVGGLFGGGGPIRNSIKKEERKKTTPYDRPMDSSMDYEKSQYGQDKKDDKKDESKQNDASKKEKKEKTDKIKVVRLRRRKGKIVQNCDVYIGRESKMGGWNLPQSKWHNPYTVHEHGLNGALQKFEEYLDKSPDLLASLHELDGKVLGCWCKPRACHGDILIKKRNEQLERDTQIFTDANNKQ